MYINMNEALFWGNAGARGADQVEVGGWGGGSGGLQSRRRWNSQRLENKTCGMKNSITCVFVTRRAKQRSERRRNQTLRQTLRLKGSTPIASGRRLKCH